jgi:hypothetical protein
VLDHVSSFLLKIVARNRQEVVAPPAKSELVLNTAVGGPPRGAKAVFEIVLV